MNALLLDVNLLCQFLQSCRGADRGTESMQQVLDRVLSKESQHIRPLCHLLSRSHTSFPQLSVLIKELSHVGTAFHIYNVGCNINPMFNPKKKTGDGFFGLKNGF